MELTWAWVWFALVIALVAGAGWFTGAFLAGRLWARLGRRL